MLAANVRWALFGTNPVHVAAGVLLSAAAKFGRQFSETVDIKNVCDALGCSIKPVRKVLNAIPKYEFECKSKSIETVGEEWLRSRIVEKASNIKCHVKATIFTVEKSSVRPQFKKSKREELLEEKERLQLKRMQDRNYAAFQRRWQCLLVPQASPCLQAVGGSFSGHPAQSFAHADLFDRGERGAKEGEEQQHL